MIALPSCQWLVISSKAQVQSLEQALMITCQFARLTPFGQPLGAVQRLQGGHEVLRYQPCRTRPAQAVSIRLQAEQHLFMLKGPTDQGLHKHPRDMYTNQAPLLIVALQQLQITQLVCCTGVECAHCAGMGQMQGAKKSAASAESGMAVETMPVPSAKRHVSYRQVPEHRRVGWHLPGSDGWHGVHGQKALRSFLSAQSDCLTALVHPACAQTTADSHSLYMQP